MAGTSALTSTARLESSGVNSTSMNVAFHWNGFSRAAWSKAELCQRFEPFTVAACLRGIPSPATNVLSHFRFRVLLAAPHQCDCLWYGTVLTISLTCSVRVRPTYVGAKFQPLNPVGGGESRQGPTFWQRGPHFSGKLPPTQACHLALYLLEQQYRPLQAVQPERSSGSVKCFLFYYNFSLEGMET